MRNALVLLAVTACGASAARPRSSTLATACTAGPAQVALFEHADYAGRCSVLGVGDYATPEATGLDNDSVSSVMVGRAVRVLICRDRAFAGECAYFDGPIARLDGRPVGNDALSSVRVEPKPARCEPAAAQIAVFADAGFAGACAVLGIGDFSGSRDIAVANDTISSVRVGPEAQALLCRDDGWGEPCERVTRDIGDLSGHRVGNDATSSIRVVRGGADCIVRGANPRYAPYVTSMEERCARSYPAILRLLATEPVYEPPLVISFVPARDFTGEAVSRDVFINEQAWNPSDIGVIDHELTHVVTMYPSAPRWLNEGVADYARSVLDAHDGWGGATCSPGETYAAGYRCAAALLRYVESRSPGAVRAMHARLRLQPFDGTIAGRGVASWWDECARGPCAPR